jgi:hypothetical protein
VIFRKVRRNGYVGRIEEMRNALRIFMGVFLGKHPRGSWEETEGE